MIHPQVPSRRSVLASPRSVRKVSSSWTHSQHGVPMSFRSTRPNDLASESKLCILVRTVPMARQQSRPASQFVLPLPRLQQQSMHTLLLSRLLQPDASRQLRLRPRSARIHTSIVLLVSFSLSCHDRKRVTWLRRKLILTIVPHTDTACQTLDKIWKASSSSFACDLGEAKTGLPLQVFVRETLRRGRATCSVLQAALLYCARLGDAMRQLDCPLVGPTPDLSNVSAALGVAKEDICFLRCPRRMFLASILISSKFLQDKTYSNRAWAKLSGLNVKDLGRIERAFLKAIDYRLVVSDGEWEAWNAESKRTRSSSACNASGPSAGLIRTQSDNVSGAAAPYDTELRAASPRVASQVAHKYRPVAEHTPQQIVAGNAASSDMCLPHPMAVRVLSV